MESAGEHPYILFYFSGSPISVFLSRNLFKTVCALSFVKLGISRVGIVLDKNHLVPPRLDLIFAFYFKKKRSIVLDFFLSCAAVLLQM